MPLRKIILFTRTQPELLNPFDTGVIKNLKKRNLSFCQRQKYTDLKGNES